MSDETSLGHARTTRWPPFICPVCRRELATGDRQVECVGCGRSCPVHFGIPDLRGDRLGIARSSLDRDGDLRSAAALREALVGRSYRDWLAENDPSRSAGDAREARQRALDAQYRRRQLETFGVHGAVMLARVDAHLADQAPAAHARWVEAAVALEAGCGEGHYVTSFSERFPAVLVTDISYVSLVQAQKLAADLHLDNVRFFAGNVEALPLPDGCVDFFHCNDVLEHVATPQAVVSESHRLLSRRGVAFFLSPNRYSLLTEPHHRVIAYGFWPPVLRSYLSRRFAGRFLSSATPLSLRALRRLFTRHAWKFQIFFLPRKLAVTGRSTSVRRLVRKALDVRGVGMVLHFVLNRLLLFVVPYHTVVAFRDEDGR